MANPLVLLFGAASAAISPRGSAMAGARSGGLLREKCGAASVAPATTIARPVAEAIASRSDIFFARIGPRPDSSARACSTSATRSAVGRASFVA